MFSLSFCNPTPIIVSSPFPFPRKLSSYNPGIWSLQQTYCLFILTPQRPVRSIRRPRQSRVLGGTDSWVMMCHSKPLMHHGWQRKIIFFVDQNYPFCLTPPLIKGHPFCKGRSLIRPPPEDRSKHSHARAPPILVG